MSAIEADFRELSCAKDDNSGPGVGLSGLGTGAPMVPIVKERPGLSEGLLGALLLAVSLGYVFAMPIATVAAQRLGCRSVLLFRVALIAVKLPDKALNRL